MKTVLTVVGMFLGFWLLIITALNMMGGGGVDRANTSMLVVFAPGTSGNQALARMASSGVMPLRTVFGSSVWLVRVRDGAGAQRVRDAGAWAVINPPMGVLPVGCGAVIVDPRRALPETLGR